MEIKIIDLEEDKNLKCYVFCLIVAISHKLINRCLSTLQPVGIVAMCWVWATIATNYEVTGSYWTTQK